jgi:hypothetical protein
MPQVEKSTPDLMWRVTINSGVLETQHKITFRPCIRHIWSKWIFHLELGLSRTSYERYAQSETLVVLGKAYSTCSNYLSQLIFHGFHAGWCPPMCFASPDPSSETRLPLPGSLPYISVLDVMLGLFLLLLRFALHPFPPGLPWGWGVTKMPYSSKL